MWRLVLQAEVRWPLLTLGLASGLGGGLLFGRSLLAGRSVQLFLIWNLFLAWVPVLLALRWEEMDRLGQGRGWKFWILFAAWLLFFPNAPYICTDLTHLNRSAHLRWWTDLIVILLFGFIGLILAFVSLHRVQKVVARRWGWGAGWLFAAVVAWLSGFGVYLGRFKRWNSWDILANPAGLMGDSLNWIHRHSLKFTLLFGLFLFIAYASLYSLTRLESAGLRNEPLQT